MANMNTFSAVGTGGIDVGQKIVRKELIEILKQNLIYYNTAKKFPVQRGANSLTVVWRQYAKLALATSALTQGVVPGGKQLVMSTVTATLAQYGDFTELSDLHQFLNDRSSIKDASMVLGIQSQETIDNLVVNVLATGTNVLYGDGSVASRVTTTGAMVLTTTQLRRMVRFLERGNVKKFGSMPVIGNAYATAVHPDNVADIRGDANFVNAINYSAPTPTQPDRGNLFTGEVGCWQGARLIATTATPYYAGAGAAGANIYGVLMYGDGAYGVTELSSGMETFIHTGGPQDTSNPLEQFATVGWKWTGAAVILDNTRLVRNEVAATYNGATV
jgi:N4-gp56 family major capsid protein